MKAIYGLAILAEEIFVVRESSTIVEVYDRATHIQARKLNLKQFGAPWDIASCNSGKCLYIFDYYAKQILKVDPCEHEELKCKWSTGTDYGLLSVTKKTNILLSVQYKNKISEYSPTGTLLREIQSPQVLGLLHQRHAIQLTTGDYLISFGSSDDTRQGICIFDGEFITASFGNSDRYGRQQVKPMQLCVHNEGIIFVLDVGNSQVLQLNAGLEFQKQLVCPKNGLRSPVRICLDESNGVLLVANNHYDFYTEEKTGEFLAFNIK